jgi:hypothetical protein
MDEPHIITIKKIGINVSSKHKKKITKSFVVKNVIKIICKIHIKKLNSRTLYDFSYAMNKQIQTKKVVSIKKNNDNEFIPNTSNHLKFKTVIVIV